MSVYSPHEHDRYLLATKLLNGAMAVVACGLGLWILADAGRRADPQWVFWLIWPMATLHTVEEYIFPGHFLRFFNLESFRSRSALGPLTARRAFHVDALTGLVNPIVIHVLSILYLPAIWFFCGLLAINAAFHISETLRTGKYFPGVATAILLYFPGFTAITTFYLQTGLLTPGQVHVTFGLALLATAMFFRQVRRWQAADADRPRNDGSRNGPEQAYRQDLAIISATLAETRTGLSGPRTLSSRNALTILLLAGVLLWSEPVSAQPTLAFPGSLDEEAWTVEAMHLGPRGTFHEMNRDIESFSLGAIRSWRYSSGVELRVGGAWFHAEGQTQEPLDPTPPQDSGADALRVFGGLRYNSREVLRGTRLFVDGTAGLLWSPGNPFPAGGTSVNGMVTWGVGAAISVAPGTAMEVGWRQAHVSNGGGIVPHNPAWDSEGLFIGVRHQIRRK